MWEPLPGINEKGKRFMNLVVIFLRTIKICLLCLSEVIQERDAHSCQPVTLKNRDKIHEKVGFLVKIGT